MKNGIYCILAVMLPFVVACEQDLKQALEASVSVYSEDGHFVDDTLYVSPSSEVVFSFEGDPDVITFYSGETGKMYDRRNMTELPATSLTSGISVTFATQYGTTAGDTFSVYLSTDYDGLSGEYDTDREMLENLIEWTDITQQCELPERANTGGNNGDGSSSVVIPLDDWLDYPDITVAFLYHTDGSICPRWEVRNFMVASTDLDTGESSVLRPADVGFSPFHEAEEGADVYNSATSNAEGRWRLTYMTDPAQDYLMGCHPSKTGVPTRSWLISNPINLKSRTPDTGEAIKNITVYLDAYNYIYDAPGLYKATFVMKRANYRYTDEKVVNVYIRVVEE